MKKDPSSKYASPERRLVGRRTLFAGLIGSVASALVSCSDKPPGNGPAHQPSTIESDTAREERYPEHDTTASMFEIGERPSKDNAYITNEVTAWDSNPVERFGGVDDPDNPPAHVNHNRFYFALPVNEFDEEGLVPGIRERSPWRDETVGKKQSLFKGRWIRVTNLSNGQIIYAQWLDTGPCRTTVECNDPDYAFDSSPPKNDFGLRAGLDLSPSAMKGLGTYGSAEVTWKFVDEAEVPSGPWKDDPPITNEIFW